LKEGEAAAEEDVRLQVGATASTSVAPRSILFVLMFS